MTLTAEAVTGQPITFKRLREVLATMGTQEGVYAAGDFKTHQRVAGANMSVETDPGDALVTVDSGVGNGAAHVRSDAVENPAIPGSHATLPRIDSVVLQYNDSAIPAGVAGNTPTVRVVQGTATAGATLDNRNGAPGGAGGPAFPGDALLLEDVLVPAASSSVVTANMRDRRRFARGLRRHLQRTAGDWSVTSTTNVLIDSANLQPRVECGGNELEVSVRSRYLNTSLALCALTPAVDGAALYSLDPWRDTPANTADHPIQVTFPFAPAAGSRLIGIMGRVASGTFLISAQATTPFDLTVTEVIRPNADNT